MIHEHFLIEHHRRVKYFTMPTQHYHDAYEIYYLLLGERNYFIKDRTYHIKKGDIVLINKYDLHRTAACGKPEHERILINFREEFLSEFANTLSEIDLLVPFRKNVNVLRLKAPEQNFVEEILYKMLEENKKQLTGFNIYLKILLVELLIFLTRYETDPFSYQTEQYSTVHKKILEIVQFINHNYMKNITLDSISKQFYISPYYFCRMFKKITGFTFVEYLNNTRVKEAQKLLGNTSLTITQIAEKVGYDNITHFERVFKKITNFSPSKYRKSLRQSQQ